jgi:hypothetical protein
MKDGWKVTQARSNAGPLPLPRKLEDGESISIYLDYPEVEKAIKELGNTHGLYSYPFVRDVEGKDYKENEQR